MRESSQIWFITTAVFGVLFTVWGSIAPSLVLIPGDYWLLVPGILMIILGVLGILDAYALEQKVIKFFENIEEEKISLADASEALNVSEDNLREIILTLRSKGKLKAHFSQETAEMLILTSFDEELCSHCGQPLTNNEFCSVCGKQENEEVED